jgi:hypothetical protein
LRCTDIRPFGNAARPTDAARMTREGNTMVRMVTGISMYAIAHMYSMDCAGRKEMPVAAR